MKNFKPGSRSILIHTLGLFVFGIALAAPPAETQETLNLKDFLKEVTEKNTSIKSSNLSAHASDQRSVEGDLITAPTLYVAAETKSDAKIGPFSFLQFDRLVTNVVSVGVQKNFNFGLQAKLHYDLLTVQYLNPQTSNLPAGFASIFSNPYTLASPVLELSQSLWSNGFGRSTRASKEAVDAQNLASKHLHQFEVQSSAIQAELAYWRLAAARQVIEVQNQAIDRARKIYEWNKNRVNLHLGEEADELQAQALVESRGLDVLAAQNEERSASRAFNSARNLDSDEVKESLNRLEPEDLNTINAPKRTRLREDVLAAQARMRATEANSVLQTEKSRPNLELYGSLAFNGQPQGYFADPYKGSTSLGDTLALSIAPNRPTYNIGVRFSVPLAFGAVSQTQESWVQENAAAQLKYERALFDQDQAWKELVQRLSDFRQHLTLSQTLEKTQKSKLEKEKERLSKGRSTTYQVLLFEQDYLFSQLGRIKDQIILLDILAQMKLFGEST